MNRSAASPRVRPLFESSAQMPDAALVQAARKQEPWAQEALYKRYVRVAVAHAHQLAPAHDPEDLAQEAMVHALLSLDALDNPQAFSAWLLQIVARKALSRLRRYFVWQRFSLLRPDDLDSEALSDGLEGEARVRAREVYEVLHRLPPEERIALVLRRVNGLELTEVAEAMGLSLATIKRRLAAAEQRLSKLKEEES